MKPTMRPPGTKRLNLKYDELLSTSAFKFNLRRYIVAWFWATVRNPSTSMYRHVKRLGARRT